MYWEDDDRPVAHQPFVHDTTLFAPELSLKDSHHSYGVLILDEKTRMTAKVVIIFSSQNELLLCKNDKVIERIPNHAIKGVFASDKPDKKVLTTDSTTDSLAYSVSVQINPNYTMDKTDTRIFLCGCLADVQGITRAVTTFTSRRVLPALTNPGLYERCDFMEFGRDGIWSRKWCVLANDRLLFYTEKRSVVPFAVITLASIKSFSVIGPNKLANLPPVPEALAHLPPEYPYMCALRHGLDSEMVQFRTAAVAEEWVEEVVDAAETTRQRLLSQAQELAQKQTEALARSESKLAPIAPAAFVPTPPSAITTHTYPAHASAAARAVPPEAAGSVLVLGDVGDAPLAQTVSCVSVAGLDGKDVLQVVATGGEGGYTQHDADPSSAWAEGADVARATKLNVRYGGSFAAVTGKGQVFVWGRGALGLGAHKQEQALPMLLTSLLRDKVVAAAAGWRHVLLLSQDGAVYSYGDNAHGQLGTNSEDAASGYPKRVSLPAKAVYVAAGAHASFAALEDGSVYAWGSNAHGVLGVGEATSLSEPTRLKGLSGGVQQISVAPNGTHVLALVYTDTATGSVATLFAWGDNDRGQLGLGSAAKVTHSAVPIALPKFSKLPLVLLPHATHPHNPAHGNPVGVAAANGASALWCSDGSCFVWGRAGPTGFGTDARSPHQLRSSFSTASVAATATGLLFLASDGALFASSTSHGVYPVQLAPPNGAVVAPLAVTACPAPAQRYDPTGGRALPGVATALLLLSRTVVSAPDTSAPTAPQARAPTLGAPAAAGVQRQPIATAYTGNSAGGPPTALGVGRNFGGPMLPTHKIENPFMAMMQQSASANEALASQAVTAVLHNANERGARGMSVDAQEVERDVMMAASLLLNIHLHGQQAQQPSAPQAVLPGFPGVSSAQTPAAAADVPPPPPPPEDDLPPPPPGPAAPTFVPVSAPAGRAPRGFVNRHLAAATAAPAAPTPTPAAPAPMASAAFPPPPADNDLPPPPPSFPSSTAPPPAPVDALPPPPSPSSALPPPPPASSSSLPFAPPAASAPTSAPKPMFIHRASEANPQNPLRTAIAAPALPPTPVAVSLPPAPAPVQPTVVTPALPPPPPAAEDDDDDDAPPPAPKSTRPQFVMFRK